MSSNSNKKRVLIIGGTGYLGQHLLQQLSNNTLIQQPFTLAFTHHSTLPPQPLLQAINSNCLTFPLDLQNGDGFDAIFSTFGQVFLFYIHEISFYLWVFLIIAQSSISLIVTCSFFFGGMFLIFINLCLNLKSLDFYGF